MSWVLEMLASINQTVLFGSYKKLDDNGHSISFRDGEWTVTKGSMVIAWRKKRRTLYMTTELGDVAVVAAGNDNASL